MKLALFIFITLCLCARGDVVVVEAHGLRVRVDGVSKDVSGEVKALVEEQAALTGDTTATPPLADDLAFFVRMRYRDLGFREAVVTWKVKGDTALLLVNEGERFRVGVISYVGNTSQKESELNAYLLRATRERLGRASANAPFVEADLKAGRELVQRYFQAQGFLNAVVEPLVFAPRVASHTVDVLVRVREGKRSMFGVVRATVQDREVEKLFKELQGQPFNEVSVETVRKKIVGIYEQRGHYVATVTSQVDAADVVYHVEPGPVFHITNVTLAPGFSKGAQRILRSNFKRETGRIYSPGEVEFLTRASLDTAVFSRLDVEPGASGTDTLTLHISGTEAQRTTLSASLGYDTFSGAFLSAEARQVNFMDSGDTMRVKAEVTTNGFNAGIKWLDPAIFETPYSLDIELAAQTFNFFDYERRTLSLRTTLKRRWNKHIFSNVFAEASIHNVEATLLTLDELGPTDYQLGQLGAELVLDYRDSPLLPTRGWMSSLTLTSAAGDSSFLRSDFAFAFYQPITKKLRAGISAESSVIRTSGGIAELPIDLRLYNGGATSVRSFPERELGPRSRTGSTPLGGLTSQTASAEVSYELVPSLELALFGDAGSLSTTDLRYAIGLGLRYKLPIGPLRIDYGYNPTRQAAEPAGALHITFGYAF